MLQCVEPFQSGFAHSQDLGGITVLAEHLLVWVLHVHATLPLQEANML